MGRRRRVAQLCLLAFLAVAGCGSNPGHNATASSHSGLTEDQFNTAVSIPTTRRTVRVQR
jgi:hypothetical protein